MVRGWQKPISGALAQCCSSKTSPLRSTPTHKSVCRAPVLQNWLSEHPNPVAIVRLHSSSLVRAVQKRSFNFTSQVYSQHRRRSAGTAAACRRTLPRPEHLSAPPSPSAANPGKSPLECCLEAPWTPTWRLRVPLAAKAPRRPSAPPPLRRQPRKRQRQKRLTHPKALKRHRTVLPHWETLPPRQLAPRQRRRVLQRAMRQQHHQRQPGPGTTSSGCGWAGRSCPACSL